MADRCVAIWWRIQIGRINFGKSELQFFELEPNKWVKSLSLKGWSSLVQNSKSPHSFLLLFCQPRSNCLPRVRVFTTRFLSVQYCSVSSTRDLLLFQFRHLNSRPLFSISVPSFVFAFPPISHTAFHHTNDILFILKWSCKRQSKFLYCTSAGASSKELDEKFQSTSLIMKEFLQWAVEADTDSLQQFNTALKTKMESRIAQELATIFAAKNRPLLRGAGTELVGQTVRPPTAVQTFAASDARVAQMFSILFRQKVCFRIFLSGVTFLQSVLAQKKIALKTSRF